MLRTCAFLAAGAMALAASSAYAATATGSVTAVDDAKHTVTLADGMVHTATPTMNLTRLQVGYVIKVSYSAEGGANKIATLEILSPSQPSGY